MSKLTKDQKARRKKANEHKQVFAEHLRLLADEVERNGENLNIEIECLRFSTVTAEQLMKKDESMRKGYRYELPNMSKLTIIFKGSDL